MRFEFSTASRILFGPGTIGEVAPNAAAWGKRALLAVDDSLEFVSRLEESLRKQGISVTRFSVSGEPTTETVRLGMQAARESDCDLVIGIGGGSVLDSGKAIAALLPQEGEIMDFLEVIGQGRALTQPSIPSIAIPTTAGTGAEVTRNAVLTSTEHRVKVSLRSHFMLPRLAVVDPELTYTLSPALTAATGMDALTQLIEAYVCNSPNPATDALCWEGIRRASGALRRAYRNGRDVEAREEMSLASLFGGMVLANAKLGAVHGLAGPLGGRLGAPHGAVCACLLPIVFETNWQALQKRSPASPVLLRFKSIAQILIGKPTAEIPEAVKWLYALRADLSIPSLSHFGLNESMISDIAAQAQKAGSMTGNPIRLADTELSSILRQSLYCS